MGDFLKTTLARVPDAFDFPDPLRLLFAWVDEQGFVVKGHDGDLYGSLSDNGWVGTSIELRGYTAEQTLSYTRSWFDESVPDPSARLWPFAQTGGEGSMAALWRDGEGRVRIVHLGSGSGSIMTCVLADDAVDFLRLLAIGYRELCWNEEFGAPPEPWDADHEIVNAPYRTRSAAGSTIRKSEPVTGSGRRLRESNLRRPQGVTAEWLTTSPRELTCAGKRVGAGGAEC